MEGFASLNTGVFILMFLITFPQETEAHCNETEAPTFGHNCSFFCHCTDNKQCDFTTGNCSNGCDFDWVGPACQRRNIIRTKDINNEAYVVTRHSSNIWNNSKFAKLAIDRNITSCSYTNYANESRSKPWWKVWLEDRHTIRNILIVTLESATGYFEGFTVTIGNVSYRNRYESMFDNSTVCYTHTSTAPETKTIHVTCSNDIIGNQVKIELASRNTQLVLCDVRIYGECQDGTFGETCTERCNPHCKDSCNKTNGTCNTCESRWTGSRCDQCSFNFYGDACEQGCGHCFNGNASCNSVNGTCLNGCEAGWKGNSCDRECNEGEYGQNCSKYCSPFCNFPAHCDKRNGSCFNGCKPGYTGSLCNNRCSEGFYGEECRQHCSEYCVNDGRICDNENGTCSSGCQEGWFGKNCSQECQNQTYGLNCAAFNCSGHCFNGSVCMATNGSCMKGCEPGWTSDTCNDECPDYTYGPQCKYNCSTYCTNNTVCNKTNGYCTEGCEPGRGGNYCKTEIVKNVDEQTHRRQAYIAAAATFAVCVLVMSVVTIALCWKKNALVGRVCPKFGKRGESFFDNAVYENTQQKRDAYSHETLDMQLEYLGINTKISETDTCGTDQVDNFYETLKRNTDVGRTYEKYEDLTG